MRLALVLGLPGCGKTTAVSSHEFKDFARLNRDEIGGKMSQLLPKLEALLQDGKDVVMDNLFTTAEDRKPFIEMGKKYSANIEAYHIATSPEDCQFNICTRMVRKFGKLLSSQEIKEAKDPNTFPPAVLFSAKKKFQSPDSSEGFNFITKIPFVRKYPDYGNKALILDYDGTLRRTKSGDKYPKSVDDVEVFQARSKKLKAAQKDGWILLGASNQSGIAKGDVSDEVVRECLDYTNKQLGVEIDYLYDGSRVPPITSWGRKPMPGMGVQFIEKYKLHAPDCIMVGDMTSDKTFAKRCGFEFVHADDFFN